MHQIKKVWQFIQNETRLIQAKQKFNCLTWEAYIPSFLIRSTKTSILEVEIIVKCLLDNTYWHNI